MFEGNNTVGKIDVHFRAFADALADGILITDKSGIVTVCNSACARLFGCAADEVLGQAAVSLILPSDRLPTEDHADPGVFCLSPASAMAKEALGVRKDRTRFPVHVFVSETEVDGEAICVITLRDLTTHRKAEADAKEFKARLCSILDTSPEAIVIIDDKGIIEMFSPAASRLFGYTSEEMIGENVKVLMPSPYREQHDGHLLHYRHTGKQNIFGKGRIMVAQRNDGSTFPMEISVGEVNGGEKPQFTAFIRDITEPQHRLQELQAELLHVSRLSVMGQMTAAIAHELNQPLTAIVNYVTAASRTLAARASGTHDSVLAQEFMHKAAQQSLRAGTIIKSLGDFVKKRASNRTPENLNKVVEEAIALSFVGAAGSKVKLHVKLDPALPPAMIDRVQIEQLLINLIRNSIEAMENEPLKKSRELSITTDSSDRKCAVITISDTGPGLPDEVMKHLFQPLITTKDRGMGMGLAICRSIVEAHAGRIWVLPDMTNGTTFCLRLPVAASSEMAA